ncbi:hypothetical protein BC833DRAFT_595224 [Globomyces pollinis-pini]|nr:hypothetical protein BC833DRAFT_595224 [Globomyces pollinis-pini]
MIRLGSSFHTLKVGYDSADFLIFFALSFQSLIFRLDIPGVLRSVVKVSLLYSCNWSKSSIFCLIIFST